MSTARIYDARTTAVIAFLCCTVLFFGSCDHHSEDHAHSGHQAATKEPAAALALTLDNGKKWPTDEHTRQTAARMVARIDSTVNIHSRQDALDLAADLDKELEALIAGCTMTGKAHDQLHVFLVALFPKVAALKEQTEPDELAHVRGEIGSLFATYEKHFE